MTYYKVLNNKGECVNGGTGRWYLPTKKGDGTWKPGRWMPAIKGKLLPCVNGYHICRPEDLAYWLHEAIFEVETRGETIISNGKVIARQARLVRKLENWDERAILWFACACAEHVLEIFENQFPEDDRPREAIEAARRFALGEATKEEIDVAKAAVGTAAWAVARTVWVTDGAVGDIDWAARAARDAAEAAARDATWAAEAAVRATGATVKCARAAGASEKRWQVKN